MRANYQVVTSALHSRFEGFYVFHTRKKIRAPRFAEARQKQDSPRSPKKQPLGEYVVSKGCFGEGVVEDSEII
jgi:hypothetical protein